MLRSGRRRVTRTLTVHLDRPQSFFTRVIVPKSKIKANCLLNHPRRLHEMITRSHYGFLVELDTESGRNLERLTNTKLRHDFFRSSLEMRNRIELVTERQNI